MSQSENGRRDRNSTRDRISTGNLHKIKIKRKLTKTQQLCALTKKPRKAFPIIKRGKEARDKAFKIGPCAASKAGLRKQEAQFYFALWLAGRTRDANYLAALFM